MKYKICITKYMNSSVSLTCFWDNRTILYLVCFCCYSTHNQVPTKHGQWAPISEINTTTVHSAAGDCQRGLLGYSICMHFSWGSICNENLACNYVFSSSDKHLIKDYEFIITSHNPTIAYSQIDRLTREGVCKIWCFLWFDFDQHFFFNQLLINADIWIVNLCVLIGWFYMLYVWYFM